jgi:predicted urease superfamily metal-dependent hydrolase
MPELKNADS